jgi:hypothetical protein
LFDGGKEEEEEEAMHRAHLQGRRCTRYHITMVELFLMFIIFIN